VSASDIGLMGICKRLPNDVASGTVGAHGLDRAFGMQNLLFSIALVHIVAKVCHYRAI
jgi:hypothetical protein